MKNQKGAGAMAGGTTRKKCDNTPTGVYPGCPQTEDGDLDSEMAYDQCLFEGVRGAIETYFRIRGIVCETDSLCMPDRAIIRRMAIDLKNIGVLDALLSKEGQAFFSESQPFLQGYFKDQDQGDELLSQALGVMFFVADTLFPAAEVGQRTIH